MKFSRLYFYFLLRVLLLSACCVLLTEKSWAVACDAIFSNGIQATGAAGNINLSYHTILTGGGATLATKTLTDNTSWVACSGASCAASGTAATTSTVTFSTGSGTNGAIAVAANGALSKVAGDYSTVSVGQQATLTFSTANGTYKTTAFTTNFKSIVELQSGDYWINGNLTIGQETILKRIATSGTTRIFVNGNVTLDYKVSTQNFSSDQLLIYATGSFTADNEASLSAFIYAGGNLSFNFKSVINGAVSGANFTASGNEVTVNYQSSALTTANFSPLCTGAAPAPVLLGAWRMDQLSWNGTAGEVIDSSGQNNHGRARIAAGSTALPSTTSGSPAYISGAQSTCRYGQFDGTANNVTRTYGYVELSGFPTLPNGFTFAAWIRSTNAGAQHQRILVRDDAQDGWGLSLADGTGQPKLRFFARKITNNGAVTGQGSNPSCGVFCIDTNAILTSNAWYYVASVIDTTAKTITLYVYNASGVLQAKTTGAYAGTWTDGTGTAAIGGESSASSEGRQTSWHFLGNIDEVNIYSGALTQTSIESLLPSVRTCPAPDHYELDMSANNLACLGADVTVRACADSVSPCTNIDYTVNSNVTVTTSAGSLTATTLPLDSGVATAKLFYPAALDGANATVTLSGEATLATNARKCCVGGTCSVNNSCTTTFNTAGLIFPNSSMGASNNIANQTAGVTSTAGTAFVRALQTNTTTGACMARFTSPQAVKMAYKCVNPSTCISGETLSLNGTGVPANANSVAINSIVYGNVDLNFDVNGSASIPINYSDVGQVQLFAQIIKPQTASDPAITLTGSSNLFVVKPYDLVVTSVTTGSNGANPATTTAGTGFTSAGTSFKVGVQSRAYAASGIHVTPNFSNETGPENIGLIINSLISPASGNSGALANPNAFSKSGNTFNNTTVSWDEVGTLGLKAHIADGNYLGAGDVSSAATTTVGRFYPDHFKVVSKAASQACGTFTYMEQPALTVNYKLQAENLSGSLVTNYHSAYSPTLATPVYSVENADSGSNLNVLNGGVDRFTVIPNSPAPTWALGVLDVLPSAAKFARLISSAKVVPDGPYESSVVGLRLTDALDARAIQTSDLNTNPATAGACAPTCTDTMLGSGFKFRFGRLRLDDAFGPETHPLLVNFATEYWTGNYFAVNASDSCTLVPRSAITYPAGAISTDANRTVALTGGSTTGTYGPGFSATNVAFSVGSAGQQFSSPNGGTGRFVVGVNLTSLPWLRFDWNQDGDYADINLPNASFEFGSYRGNDRIIYWREKLQ
jgi:hypothetical protein